MFKSIDLYNEYIEDNEFESLIFQENRNISRNIERCYRSCNPVFRQIVNHIRYNSFKTSQNDSLSREELSCLNPIANRSEHTEYTRQLICDEDYAYYSPEIYIMWNIDLLVKWYKELHSHDDIIMKIIKLQYKRLKSLSAIDDHIIGSYKWIVEKDKYNRSYVEENKYTDEELCMKWYCEGLLQDSSLRVFHLVATHRYNLYNRLIEYMTLSIEGNTGLLSEYLDTILMYIGC